MRAAAAHAATVSAYPLPGTRTAGAQTQISLRGAPPAALGDIVVTGSRSGRHTGRLRPHSDGIGASYVLTKPLRAGERVTVRTGLDIAGARDGDYGFTVARRPPKPPTRPAELSNVGTGLVQRFVTRPDLVPPAVDVTTSRPGTAPGMVFVAPKAGRGQDGPMILDGAGHVVWFKPAGNREEAADFRVQTYQGRSVLTWWQGRLVGGEGRGEGVIYDEHYRPVRRVRAGNGFSADLHEFELTPQGTALLLSYDRVKMDLRPYRRVARRHGRRRRRAGGRRRHRARGVRVAQRRQRVLERLDGARAQGQRGLGLHASQLGRARRRRELHRLGPARVDRLQDRPRARAGSPGGWAASPRR